MDGGNLPVIDHTCCVCGTVMRVNEFELEKHNETCFAAHPNSENKDMSIKHANMRFSEKYNRQAQQDNKQE